MKTPVVLIIPVFMLIDYYLTILGAVLYKRDYGNHVKLPQYELNPIWQKDINRRRFFNTRFLGIVLGVTVISVYISQTATPLLVGSLQFPFGMILAIYAIIIGRHLGNILTFRFVSMNPDSVDGQVRFSQEMSLKVSQYNILAVLFPLVLAATIARNTMVNGALTGVILLGLVHYFWIWRYRRKFNQKENL
jgi:hypothetical protein